MNEFHEHIAELEAKYTKLEAHMENFREVCDALSGVSEPAEQMVDYVNELYDRIEQLETENKRLRTVDKPQIMLDQLDKELDALVEDYPDFPLFGTLTMPANVVRGARLRIRQLEAELKRKAT